MFEVIADLSSVTGAAGAPPIHVLVGRGTISRNDLAKLMRGANGRPVAINGWFVGSPGGLHL